MFYGEVFLSLAYPKSDDLKLSQLLSQFLYQTKKLDLPGIGSFTLDPAAVIPEESDRIGQVPASGIQFRNANIQTPDDSLITFIKEHTGKMKPLAAADLDFFLTTGKQLLNIGKPFYLEGIGTLIKNKDGKLDFTPGEYMVMRVDDPAADRKTSNFDEPPRDQEDKNTNARQGLLLLGLFFALVVIAWGGYYLYKRNTYVEPEKPARVIPDTTPSRTDTGTNNLSAGADSGRKPSVTETGAVAGGEKPGGTPATGGTAATGGVTESPAPGSILYRFVILETTNKNHALRRYNQLLGYQLNIKMDQKDSAYFKLFFPISAVVGDTTHIKDSLADVYAAHVRIER